ncbi:kinesin-like protein KIF15 isoform X4 [Acropora millepora]|uniref:kinesin-like protein KIF15 isoform X4 n=1 Tax=Acropora millepora TaxID=45264 RepID=UPI001CF4C341|nr:kinesin-like protein KIF15 isoform X4 [Acropora millepora]
MRINLPSRGKEASSGGYESGEGDNIRVYVRVRPPSKHLETDVDRTPCLEVTSGNTVVLYSKPDAKNFSFDHVADINTTQEEVFGAVGKKIVEGCVSGYNGTIFAYGQTGSGKTFTMLGPAEGEEESFTHQLRGVIPRAFEYLFSLINREQEKHGDHVEFLCRCSFLEIYNEQIFDLLDPASIGLSLREDIKKGVFVDGLLERDVGSARDAYRVLNSGWLNRRVASTSMNRESSRSHAVFTVTLESKERKAGMASIKVSRLHLVDLAGSERQKDTHAEGVRLKEASSINKSLSALGNVIMALVDITHGKNRHVHYRDSKLTFLLRDSLGGNAKTYLIANVHPSAKCFGETLSTLNFAKRAKMIKNKAVVNEDATGSITALQAEIRRLRDELEKARAGIPKQITRQESTEVARKNSQTRGEVCADTTSDNNNNTPGVDLNQQYREWKQMMVAATAARERAEQEKQCLVEKVQKLEELCSKKEKFLQSTKMILKFRESTISRLERLRQREKEGSDTQEDGREREIQLLKEEISVMKDKIEHHPDVTRFAMENLELRAELKYIRSKEEDGTNYAQDLAKSHRYSLQLERQLRELLQSPQGSELERSLSNSLVNLEASNAELEKFKLERAQLQTQLESTREELTETREGLQQMKEKLVGQEESFRKKCIDFDAEVLSLRKANAELERALEAHQLKTAVERTTLNDIHMQTIKSLTSPRKLIQPNRLSPHTAASTPKRSPASIRRSKLASSSSPVIGTPDEKPKPPNGLIRRDSYEQVGSDSEMDEPFFNFDSEEMDDEELYCESLLDELKRQQEMNNAQLQQLQTEEANRIRLNQNINKLEHQVQNLTVVLSSEREKHAASETELNMKNLGLADKLKEARGEVTVLRSEVDDLKCSLQASERQVDSSKKERDMESIESGRRLASLESKLTRLEIENYNQQIEMETNLEMNQHLQADVETLRDELEFKNHKIEEYEGMLQSERQRVKDLGQELQATLEKLDIQTETNNKLLAQQDKQQDMVQALEQLVALRTELQESNSTCEQQAQKIHSLSDELEEAKTAIRTLNKRKDSDLDCINNMMGTVKDLKKSLSEKDSELSFARNQLEESKIQQQDLCNSIEEKKRTIEKLKDKFDRESEKFNKERMDRENEMGQLRDDLRRTTEQYRELNQALAQQQQQITSLQSDLTDKTLVVSSLAQTIKEMENSKAELESRYESRLNQLQQLNESLDASGMFESQEAELDKLRSTQANMTKVIDNLEAHRQEKNEEMEILRCKVVEMEEVVRNNDLLETHCKTLSYQLEAEIEAGREREERFKKEAEKLRKELESAFEKQRDVTAMKDKILMEKESIASELAAAKLNMETALEDAEYMVEELERTRLVEKQVFEEKEELKSKLESTMEDKFKLEKTMNKMEEENARLKGHQNPAQKLQHLLAIKKENHSLKEQVNKLIKENQKCSCKGKKPPLSNKNGSEEAATKQEGGFKASVSSEEGMSPTNTDKENVFTTSM